MRSRRVPLWVCAGVLVSLVACKSDSSTGDDDDVDTSLVLAIVAGNTQTATVGSALTVKPAVKVTRNDGSAVANVPVTFSVAGGGGSITGASQTTGADGIATVGGWTLGTTAGANALTASVANASPSSVTFGASGTAGAAAQMTSYAGGGGSSAAGLAVSTRPAVRIVDAYGNPVGGVTVQFAIGFGFGALTGGTQTTDANGIATVGSWTLGTTAGANSMTATPSGTAISAIVTFETNGVPGPVANLGKVAGDNLQAFVGALLGTPPSVRASDQFGNFISTLPVTFAVASGGGSATGTNPTTNVNGIATVGSWTLGATPGANTMTATAQGVTVTFTATALAAFNAAQYAGTYNGTWTNTTFGSVGTGSAVVVVNQGAGTATVTVNVTGNVLGAGGVTNSVNNGTFTNNGVTFNGNVPPMGNISATLGTNGAISATGTNVPGGGIAGWTATGTLTANSLNLSFVVTFTNQTTGVGTITMTK